VNELRKAFHHRLDEIHGDIVLIAALVTEAIPKGTEVLLSGDLNLADVVITGDDLLDARSLEAEEKCFQVLALQAPMARDLRAVVTAVHLIGEIERSGDLVVNICKGARRLYGVDLDPKLRGLIAKMGEQAHQLFGAAVKSYIESDAALAGSLNDRDDVLDALHREYIQAIFETHASHQLELQVGVQLALIGRFYERIGDHAVNIGERVRYMITGWMPEHAGAMRVQRAEQAAMESLNIPDDADEAGDPEGKAFP
jgi:phosphate transport system protein